jgi:predicted RNase H-like nuclease (RuvC/YqgF family)
MTDKQIIIDGVDVIGCEFFDSGNCVECDMRVHFYGDIPCDDECNRNCYYKQLKRKEQEVDVLKAENELLKQAFEDSDNDCFRLEKENDELKRQLKAKEQECEELTNQVDYLRREYKEIKWTNEAISRQCQNINCKDLQKLKQTLAEIKEIAEQIENYDLYVTVPAKARMGDKIKINLIGIQDILNITSEVEDE